MTYTYSKIFRLAFLLIVSSVMLFTTSMAKTSSGLPAYGVSVDGIGAGNVWPPDTNIAVGATQIVQVVNVRYAIYDKSGNLQSGPTDIRDLFMPLTGSYCSDNNNGGQPKVLYDQLAQRWLISRLSRPVIGGATLWHLCIAVSQSSNAAGSYNLYDYDYGLNKPDGPTFSVWPDAYYFAANIYNSGGTFVGAQTCAFDRNAMIAGAPTAALICFQANSSVSSLQPANLDGTLLPPSGSPNYFLRIATNTQKLQLYKFHVDFAVPGNSTFTGPTNITVSAFTAPPALEDSVPQPVVSDKLASFGDRLMYRLSYRNFGGYESLVVNHTVRVSAVKNQTAVRWYEIRNPGGMPSVAQQNAYSPDSSTYRFLGSIAQDKQGNMLLGYSASSTSVFPAIRYTGRRVDDPPNQMENEGIIQPGGGSQILPAGSPINRWGHISSVAIDPADDCTFWFTSEYLKATGTAPNWSTRLASVRFPACH